MSELKYLCSPNNDMAILFDNVFGINFTKAVISGEEPKDDKWIQPFFTSKTDAFIFQDILINKLSIDETPADKLETELMTGDMYYEISIAVLLKLRKNVESFLNGSDPTMKIEGQGSILSLCGLGSAGVPLLYNSYNQSMTAAQVAGYIDGLIIESRESLQLNISSNSSAAQSNYTFNSMGEMRQQFAANLRGNNTILAALIGTRGSLASEIYKALNTNDSGLQHNYSTTQVYGYLFPNMTQGTETYGSNDGSKTLSEWKTLSMAALTTVYTKDQKYYQQVPVRRSLTRVRITNNL